MSQLSTTKGHSARDTWRHVPQVLCHFCSERTEHPSVLLPAHVTLSTCIRPPWKPCAFVLVKANRNSEKELSAQMFPFDLFPLNLICLRWNRRKKGTFQQHRTSNQRTSQFLVAAFFMPGNLRLRLHFEGKVQKSLLLFGLPSIRTAVALCRGWCNCASPSGTLSQKPPNWAGCLADCDVHEETTLSCHF